MFGHTLRTTRNDHPVTGPMCGSVIRHPAGLFVVAADHGIRDNGTVLAPDPAHPCWNVVCGHNLTANDGADRGRKWLTQFELDAVLARLGGSWSSMNLHTAAAFGNHHPANAAA